MWLLGRWSADRRVARRGALALADYRADASEALMRTPEGIERYRTARLQSEGFRPMHPYRIQGEPTSEVVSAVQRGEWETTHLTDRAYLASLDAGRKEKSAALYNELRSEYAAMEMHRYAFRRRFSVSVNGRKTPSNTPTQKVA